jgi:VanZ family protein
LGRIFIVILCLIVYGSLYPWQFHAVQLPTDPLTILLHAWPTALDRFVIRDGILNVAVYVPLGIFGYLYCVRHFRKAYAALVVLILALVLCTGIEIAQLFEPSRYCSALDVVCNCMGAALGILVAGFYSRSLEPVVAWDLIRPFLHPNGSALLLLCWMGYQTMPLFPRLSTTQVIHKIKVLGSPASLAPVEMVASVVDWLAVNAVVEDMVGPADAGILAAAALLLLPGRLLLDKRSVTGAECIGGALAWIVWFGYLNRQRKRLLLLAWLAVGALILRGLAPFQFTADASSFSWIPFAATLSYEHALSVIVLFQKCFLYGVAVWLFRKAGYGYIAGAVGIAAVLGAIEAVQRHLPGRTAEITDPLLALTMAVLLFFADRHKETALGSS